MSNLRKKSLLSYGFQGDKKEDLQKHNLLKQKKDQIKYSYSHLTNFYPSSARKEGDERISSTIQLKDNYVYIPYQKKQQQKVLIDSKQGKKNSSLKNQTNNQNKGSNRFEQSQNNSNTKQDRKSAVNQISKSKMKLKQILQTSQLKFEDKCKLQLDQIFKKIVQYKPQLSKLKDKSAYQLVQIILKQKQTNFTFQKYNTQKEKAYTSKANQFQTQKFVKQSQQMNRIIQLNKQTIRNLKQKVEQKDKLLQKTKLQLIEANLSINNLNLINQQLAKKDEQNAHRIDQINATVCHLQKTILIFQENQSKYNDYELVKAQLDQLRKIIAQKQQKQRQIQQFVVKYDQLSKQLQKRQQLLKLAAEDVIKRQKYLQLERNKLILLENQSRRIIQQGYHLEQKQRLLAQKQIQLQQIINDIHQGEDKLAAKIDELQRTMDETWKQKASYPQNNLQLQGNFIEYQNQAQKIKNQLLVFERQLKQKVQNLSNPSQVQELSQKLQLLVSQYQTKISKMEKSLSISNSRKQGIRLKIPQKSY